MSEIEILSKLVDLNIVSLSIQIAFFVYFLCSKWSKK